MRASIFLRGGAAVLVLHFVLSASALLAAGGGAAHDLTDQMRRWPVRELAAGKLLVAARNLPDPNFAQTVVLLTEFTTQGAIGLIVNRSTDVTLAGLLPGLEHSRAQEIPIFFGGPVPERGVLALARSASARSGSRHLVGDVYLVNTREVLEEMLSTGAGSNRLRVYVGYAGWGAGQLDRETAQGAWHVLDGDGDVVFDKDPDSAWQRQMRRIEARSAEHQQAFPLVCCGDPDAGCCGSDRAWDVSRRPCGPDHGAGEETAGPGFVFE